ncbi:MAG: chromate resistance protein ChrB domain-containing protein [Nitrososphaerales archaeon]
MGKWITREHVHVDRVACPWLIKRCVDPQAEFIFVPPDRIQEVARRENAIPFDAQGVELGHHGKDCSFESIIKKYKIEDPIMQDVAKIVHSADVQEDIDLSPEAKGLEAISRGQMFLVKDDYDAIERGAFLYECLYQYCKYLRMYNGKKEEIESTPREQRFELLKKLMSSYKT